MRGTDEQKVGKPELCAKVAERTQLPLRAVYRFFDAYHDIVIEEVKKGNEVHVRGFGKFSRKFIRGQVKKHPTTGEDYEIRERWRPIFGFGKAFKREIGALLTRKR